MLTKIMNRLGFDTKKQLRGRLNRAVTALDEQLEKNKELTELLDLAYRGLSEASEKVFSLSHELGKSESERSTLMKELEGARGRIVELQAEVEDLNNELNIITEELTEMTEILDTVTGNI